MSCPSLSCSVVRPIGYDAETDRAYFLELILDEVPGATEFSFFISEREADGSERRHWRPEGLRGLFSREDRAAILNELMSLASAMMTARRPETFSMATFDADLPEKALRKYQELVLHFAFAGYAFTLEKYHGRRIWRMVRQSDADMETAS